MSRLGLALLLAGCTGFQSSDTPPRPRLVAPLSTSTVSVPRPTLRFTLPPPLGAPIVDVCARRSCEGTRLSATVDAGGTRAVPDSDLAPGVWYWRVRAGSSASAVWQFYVQPTGGAETTWGSHLDLDGDGFDELAVGAPEVDIGLGTTGRIYLYGGGPDGPNPSSPLILDAPAGANGFGHSLAAVDFDGDGFADLAVGAPALSVHGSILIYRGGPGGLQRPAAFVLEDDEAVGLGWSLDCAGDVDGDGYGDLISGAPTSTTGMGTVSGAAFLLFGGAADKTPIQPLMPDESARESIGYAVAGGSDLNGDGFTDMMIGAPGASTSAGRVFVYLARVGGAAGNPLTLAASPPPLAHFGTALVSLGDTDGDGRGDFAVGASEMGPGRVYLGTGGDTPQLTGTLDGPGTDGAGFGSTLACADFDGDGKNDLVVGAICAPGSDPTCPGAVYVAAGGMLTAFPAPAGVVSYGAALSTGDLDGDGHPDLTVGASQTNGELGRVDWYRNAAGMPRVFNGSDTGGRFGFAVR
jgi:hypothetical protein